MNYYQLLGVDPKADAKTIKNAFRKLAKKYHPDINPGDARAEKMFKDINEAYTILSDDVKRMDYDATLRAGQGSEAGYRNTQSAQRGTSQKKSQQRSSFMGGFSMKFDFDDIMGAGMEYEREAPKDKQAGAAPTPDFLNFNQQFANFFGFKPR